MKAIFLDKDGTLIENVPYNVDPARISLLPGAVEGLQAFAAAGYRLIVVSNQAGVARGYFPESALAGVEARLGELLASAGVQLAGFYYCPHHPEGTVAAYRRACLCRKPQPGLIQRAAIDHSLDLSQCWLIGDILDDVQAGRAAGCRTVLVDNGGETEWLLTPERRPHLIVRDLSQAACLTGARYSRQVDPGRTRQLAAPIVVTVEVIMDARRSPAEGNLLQYISAFGNLSVLVIGDAMLDVYLEGRSDRLCREAPVPVVTIAKQKQAAGGAANTAANIASLGGKVAFLSVAGDDADGALLRETLESAGVATDHLLAAADRRTIAKRRILSAGQMLIRYDEGSTGPLAAENEHELIDCLRELFPTVDAVIVSDYGYGILSARVVQTLAELQNASPRVLVVDAKDLVRYRDVGVTAVKPNYGEACRLLGIARLDGACARAGQMASYGERILAMTGAHMAAVTLDSEGALLFGRGDLPYRTYADPRPDSHAAGAGDSFISALGLALAAGAGLPEAAELASAAATVVVAREGTTCCSARELWGHFATGSKYVADPELLAARLAALRQECRRIVFTNGCFDILHRGHITYLNQAKSRGDILVLAVNSDASVQRLKGPTRPINSLEDRVNVLSALSCVDFVTSFDEDTPIEVLRAIRPDVYVKGGDYTLETLPEAPVVQALGGTVEILPYIEERSTTGLIQRIRAVYALAE